MVNQLTKMITTFFYAGYFPRFPGTFTSFLTAVICYFFPLNIIYYIGMFSVVTLLGLVLSHKMEIIVGKKDPSCVVIDEVAGMFVACFLLPKSILIYFAAFVLFRFFDIRKPFPVKQLESLKGSLGIMSDDLMAGIYTNIFLHGALFFITAITSSTIL